ncbi:MAG: hypothetical protein QNK23_13590 [Crocinitomicaceae bacterium]|nr:hypothetical protein [Crocinitomicaceae bacterium]
MKNLLLIISFSLGLTATFAQTTITLPGDGSKAITIKGELLGEMIRSTGGVDKKSEKYYYNLSGEILTIWKHIYLLEENKTEALYITKLPLAEIDWAYFESSFPEGPSTKKVAGREYYVLSINTQRGKRFKQEKYYQSSEAASVTAGNVDINITDADALKAFYDKLLGAKK